MDFVAVSVETMMKIQQTTKFNRDHFQMRIVLICPPLFDEGMFIDLLLLIPPRIYTFLIDDQVPGIAN